MGSLQSALLGYGICKLFKVQPFGAHENVILQTTSVAAATMPLAAGFVSVIPALGCVGLLSCSITLLDTVICVGCLPRQCICL